MRILFFTRQRPPDKQRWGSGGSTDKGKLTAQRRHDDSGRQATASSASNETPAWMRHVILVVTPFPTTQYRHADSRFYRFTDLPWFTTEALSFVVISSVTLPVIGSSRQLVTPTRRLLRDYVNEESAW